GSLIGFAAGFYTWQTVYLAAISRAPVAWLPATFGYGGALVIHLLLLGLLAVLLLRFVPPLAAGEGGRLTLARLYEATFRKRWNPLVTGGLVGLIGVFAYFRVQPLGVTSQLSSLTRTVLENNGLLAGRLNGLDTFAGCAAVVVETITENGWLISGLVLGSLAVAVLAGRFELSTLTVRNSITALLGGILMG